MTTQMPHLQEVIQRLERLERQNRRMKRVGVVSLLLASCLLLMGQAPRRPTGIRTVEAERFVLKDHMGRERATLEQTNGAAWLTLADPSGKGSATLQVSEGEAKLYLGNKQDVHMAELRVVKGEPWLDLIDGSGFRTIVGSTDLVTTRTGESHKTSAASLLMLNPHGNVIWRAP